MTDKTTILQVEEKTLKQIKDKFQNFSMKKQLLVLGLMLLLLVGLIIIAVDYYGLGQEKEECNKSNRTFDIDLDINDSANDSFYLNNQKLKEDIEWYRTLKPDLKT